MPYFVVFTSCDATNQVHVIDARNEMSARTTSRIHFRKNFGIKKVRFVRTRVMLEVEDERVAENYREDLVSHFRNNHQQTF